MQAAKAHGTPLPDEAFALWLRDELAGLMGVPDDGSRVEIVGGEIVVSPGPGVSHNSVVIAIQEAFMAAKLRDAAYPWQAVHTTDLAAFDVRDGYIPDLIILRRTDFAAAAAAQDAYLTPDVAGMVIEVTSHSNAERDRQPSLRHRKRTKWNLYARANIPFYLLVDRAPSVGRAALFFDPDPVQARYDSVTTWEFGKPLRLPAPFDLTIETDTWDTWNRD